MSARGLSTLAALALAGALALALPGAAWAAGPGPEEDSAEGEDAAEEEAPGPMSHFERPTGFSPDLMEKMRAALIRRAETRESGE